MLLILKKMYVKISMEVLLTLSTDLQKHPFFKQV